MDIPNNIKFLLKNKSFCTMATCGENKPYLSLMNFTYVETKNKIILSSRINSKKYSNIQKNKNISLLISSISDGLSATFLGTAVTMEDKEGDNYREMHLKKNNMPQFIIGDNIGLIIFSIEEIILSDKEDQVKYID
ncbi:pyridoxamine 5'-phosphate oxidase family protein [Halanaerobium hydrogeniformans]|uniref:Pyridoxamine 5'-phosphate oxidase-related FMN-binding protein n=1 Tax=Halanaerobium hydrogeniformans TaxID=656519 RepID=E4RKE7_HALHG|nr:pyridoxamine 5'-phosphate oxidase family protein [Halanaerobium hydrogeniformans]ADQ14656.1 pyridoxamine 5'-phosphate oxidase-related FMN-binding protein [Halanaerobium hydrogeniformans]